MNSRYKPIQNSPFRYLCIPSDVYTITLSDSEKSAWDEDSYIQFDEAIWNGHIFYLRLRYDSLLNVPTEVVLHLQTQVPKYSSWYVLQAQSIPLHWFDPSVTHWEKSSYSNFPPSKSQFQLFKKEVVVDIEKEHYNMIVITVLFKDACVIYFDEVEIYRFGIAQDEIISNSTLSTAPISELRPRRISLPVER